MDPTDEHDIETIADQEGKQITARVDVKFSAAGEVSSNSPDQALGTAAVEQYGSWSQYEQFQPTTLLQSDQTVTDTAPGQYLTYPTYATQEVQAVTAQSSVSTPQYAFYSAEQTYQVAAQAESTQSSAYTAPSSQFAVAQETVTSFAAYATVRSQQTNESAYTTSSFVDSALPVLTQVGTGQPTQHYQSYQPINSYCVEGSSLPSLPSRPVQASGFIQAQFTAQAGIQATSTGYQALQVGPDGQFYAQSTPIQPSPPTQSIVYQVPDPNNLQYITTPTGQVLLVSPQQQQQQQHGAPPFRSGTKIWNKETAIRTKDATINATKKAYDKSKEFISSKDGARQVAKTTWKQSKVALVKSNELIDRFVKPLMPFIALADPEVAAALRATSAVGAGIKASERKQVEAQRRAQGQQGGQQQQLDPAALANLAPLLALLQQAAQTNAARGNQISADAQGQARLLAALLQIQQQQQTLQPQIQGQQSQAQQTQVQQQQPRPMQNMPKRKPVSSGPAPATAPPALQEQQLVTSTPSNTLTADPTQAQEKQAESLQTLLAGLTLESQPTSPYQQHIPPPASATQLQAQQVFQQLPTSQQPSAQQVTTQQFPHGPPASVDILPQQMAIPDNTTSQSTSWTHQALHAFGIEDILLPPNSSLMPAATHPHTTVTGRLPWMNGTFSIELFHNSTLLQRHINALQSLPTLSSTPQTHILEVLAVRPELNPAALVAADCVVSLPGQQRASYKILLQSRSSQGFGLLLSSDTGMENVEAAKDTLRHMAVSIRFGVGTGKEVSSFHFIGETGAYTHSCKPSKLHGTGDGVAGTGSSMYASGGYQVFASPDGVSLLVLTDDNLSAEADVRVVELRDGGRLRIDGREYVQV